MTTSTPSLGEIAQYWQEYRHARIRPIDNDWSIPFCFKCKHTPPVSHWDNAHPYLVTSYLQNLVIAHAAHISNFVPLCQKCVQQMPIFDNHYEALNWVLSPDEQQ